MAGKTEFDGGRWRLWEENGWRLWFLGDLEELGLRVFVSFLVRPLTPLQHWISLCDAMEHWTSLCRKAQSYFADALGMP